MKKKFLIPLCVVALAATALVAQPEPAPYITLHQDTIDPAQLEAFEKNNKEWVEIFQKAKAGKDYYWRAYQSGFTYTWVSDMPNFAYLDASEAREEALNEILGEGTLEKLMAENAPPIIEHHTEIWKFQPELSYWPEDFDASKMNAINVSIDSIKPGKGEDFRGLVKEAVGAMKKIEADANWFAYSVPFGKGSYAFVSWGEDRAALHGGPDMGKLLTEALGAEGSQEMWVRWLDAVASTEDRDWRVRRDLAYLSDEAVEKQATE
jgi:hypothetical protein